MNEILEITPGIPLMLSSTSKGDAMKWYQPETNCYLKANRVDHGREYQDAIAEVIASRVGELLHILVVQYQLCHIRIDDEKLLLGTISHNFCHKNESFISFETMVESSDAPIQWAVSAKENYALVIDLFRTLTGLDARDYLNTMLLFDFLICNEDRHLNNFGVLKDETDGSYRFPPLFDSGYALGFHAGGASSGRAVPVFLQSQTILYELFQTAALGKSAPERDCPAGQHSGYRIRWSAAVCTDARLLPYDSADKIAAAKGVFRMKPVDFTIYWEETPVVQVCYDENNKPQFTVLNPSHLPVLLFGMNGQGDADGCTAG